MASNQRLIAALEEALGTEYAKDVLAGKRGVVTTCGSGMTAGVLWLGLQLLGVKRVGLYDEVSFTLDITHVRQFMLKYHGQSWTGYAAREGSPIVKGEQ